MATWTKGLALPVKKIQRIGDMGDGWFVDPDHRVETPKTSPRSAPFSAIVLHWTASPVESAADEINRIKRWAARTSDKSSTHFCILRNGEVWQMVPLTKCAWHAGASSWQCAGWSAPRSSCNKFAVGIDILNVGPLTELDGMFFDSYDKKFTGDVVADGDKYFERATDAQIYAARILIGEIRKLCPTIAARDVVRHCDVSPGRKIDTGPILTAEILGIC